MPTATKDDLWQMYQTVRQETVAKLGAVQSVLSWGAALLLGATAIVLGVIGEGRDSSALIQFSEWLFLVLVSAAVTFQYAAEMANISRSAAYGFRLENEIQSVRTPSGVPYWEHWVGDTQSWIAPPLWLSAIAVASIVAGAQAVPFVFGNDAFRPGLWGALYTVGVIVSLAAPLAFGVRAHTLSSRSIQAISWDDAAEVKSFPRVRRWVGERLGKLR